MHRKKRNGDDDDDGNDYNDDDDDDDDDDDLVESRSIVGRKAQKYIILQLVFRTHGHLSFIIWNVCAHD